MNTRAIGYLIGLLVILIFGIYVIVVGASRQPKAQTTTRGEVSPDLAPGSVASGGVGRTDAPSYVIVDQPQGLFRNKVVKVQPSKPYRPAPATKDCAGLTQHNYGPCPGWQGIERGVGE